ncbi:hypothetical protein LZ32DRAFT_608744, partial [Colletotrichum eremochloae]
MIFVTRLSVLGLSACCWLLVAVRSLVESGTRHEQTHNHPILSSFLPCLDLAFTLPYFHCGPTFASGEIVWDSASFPQPPVPGQA